MKKTKKKNSGKSSLIVFLLIGVLIISIVGGNTLARVSKQAETDNIIDSGEIKVELLNQTSDGEPMPELITHIVPGDTLDNKVTVKNACEHDEYIRITLDKVIYESTDNQIVLDDSKANFLFNEEDWTYKDGYYYYNHILPTGATSECLYDGIYLDTSMGNEYRTAVLEVDILVEAVQSINNGTDVFTAEGWEVIIK